MPTESGSLLAKIGSRYELGCTCKFNTLPANAVFGQFLEAEPPEKRASDHDYIIEKLRYFMAYFSEALMPIEDDEHTLEERLKLAGDYLEKVETSI